MLTTSPFGFISYNSYDFLKYVLTNFIDDGVFSRCACWFHESLDENKKNHFHCWVEPVKKIDTSSIAPKFVELSDTGAQNSIAILPKCKSDWNNAYLYGIHDKDYLCYKNIVREVVNIKSEYHIYLGDFASDIQQAEYFRFHTCLAPYLRIRELVEGGHSLEDVYILLRTPFAQLRSVRIAYYNILRELNYTAPNNLIELNDVSPVSDHKKTP